MQTVEKCRIAGPATEGDIIRRLRFACWITKATDIHLEYVTQRFFTTTTVARRRLNVTLYVHCMACLLWLVER